VCSTKQDQTFYFGTDKSDEKIITPKTQHNNSQVGQGDIKFMSKLGRLSEELHI
jgi:hypothetical protein